MIIEAPARTNAVQHSTCACGRAIRSCAASSFDRRELAAHLVHRPRTLDTGGKILEHVEIGQAGLHHEDVRAFLCIAHGAQVRILRACGIELIGGAILRSRLRRGFGGFAEGAVEAGVELGRVAHHQRAFEPRFVEACANRRDAAVHHVARRHAVGARLRVRHGGARELLHARLVRDVVLLAREHAAVAVARVRAQAHVHRDPQARTELLAQRFDLARRWNRKRSPRRASRQARRRAAPCRCLPRGRARPGPRRLASVSRNTPVSPGTASRARRPSTTKCGWMSCAGLTRTWRVSSRMKGSCLSRRSVRPCRLS